MLMLVAWESVTSWAVQVRFWLLPCAFQTSWIQVCADATWGPESSPPTAKTAIKVKSNVRHERICIISDPFSVLVSFLAHRYGAPWRSGRASSMGLVAVLGGTLVRVASEITSPG